MRCRGMNAWLVIVGAVLIADTLLIMLVSNINLGVLLPAILGTPILLYGLFFDRIQAHTAGGISAVIKWAVIAVYALYITATAAAIVVISVNGHKHVDKGADAVIVLGAAVHGDKISLTLLNRLDLALEYIEGDDDAVIVVSGAKGRQELISEAEASRDYLLSRGFPEERIIVENRARNTYQNFAFSKELLDKHFDGDYSAVYVTNSFHVYRAGLAAREAGLVIDGIGCGAKLYIQPNNYLRESVAVIKYWLIGAK